MSIEKCKNYVKQRLFLGREAGLTLLTTSGIILLCVSSNAGLSNNLQSVTSKIKQGTL